MEQILKEAFPSFRILNYSEKSTIQIPIILGICCKNKNIIVYIKKNENNKDYFEILDNNERENCFNNPDKKFVEVVLNLDNYVGFKSENMSIEKKIRDIQKILIDHESCSICYTSFDEAGLMNVCSNCSNYTCNTCFSKLLYSQLNSRNSSNNLNTGIISVGCPSCRQPNNLKILN